MLMWLDDFNGTLPPPAILKPEELWTGKQIFSMILPSNVNMIRRSIEHPDDETTNISPGDTQVIINRGQLIAGILDKKTLGTSQGSLVHFIMNEYGHKAAKIFLTQTQLMVNYWLLHRGFSVGIADTVADMSTMDDINNIINSSKSQVRELIIKAQNGSLVTKPGTKIYIFFNHTGKTFLTFLPG